MEISHVNKQGIEKVKDSFPRYITTKYGKTFTEEEKTINQLIDELKALNKQVVDLKSELELLKAKSECHMGKEEAHELLSDPNTEQIK